MAILSRSYIDSGCYSPNDLRALALSDSDPLLLLKTSASGPRACLMTSAIMASGPSFLRGSRSRSICYAI